MNKISPDLVDQILHRNCLDGMKKLPDECIPMTLTSPPYDDLRRFGGHSFDFKTFNAVAEELFRVSMPGGIVVWVVQDSIVNGGESGTSDAQKAYFRSLGFRVYQTIFVVADSHRNSSRRYYRQTSLALILSKGRPRTSHLLADRANSTAGTINRLAHRGRDGSIVKRSSRLVPPHGIRGDAWNVAVGWGKSTKDYYAFEHPALMPESLANDLIRSWSSPGDLVLDPMCGAATSCKMALLNHRHYLGFEVHRPYYQLAVRRMQDAHAEYRLRLDDWLLGA